MTFNPCDDQYVCYLVDLTKVDGAPMEFVTAVTAVIERLKGQQARIERMEKLILRFVEVPEVDGL